jgi:RNA polymerase sigma-70 factor, ECF subfamily
VIDHGRAPDAKRTGQDGATKEAEEALAAERREEAQWRPVPDAELVARVIAGDYPAFSALMQRYNRTLYRAARGITGDDGEAEDVVQEAWVRAYTHLAEFRGESRLATWLVRITLNEALGRKRRARPTLEINEIDQDQGASVIMFSSAPADPESDLSRRQIGHILAQAIDSLPPSFRAVFMLRAVEEMSVEEVALQLGIPEATVRTRMHRCRALLGKAIENEIGACLKEAFPFAGARCRNMRARVLARVKELDESRQP